MVNDFFNLQERLEKSAMTQVVVLVRGEFTRGNAAGVAASVFSVH